MITVPPARNSRTKATSPSQDCLPRTKSGKVKRRTSWDDKLRVLDPTAPAAVTEKRLKRFQKLFAFRRTDGVITRTNEGPREWTALRGPLTLNHIARHLLAARIPTLSPQWVGARSLETSLFCCLDVDADRTPQQQLKRDYPYIDGADDDIRGSLLAQQRYDASRPPFNDRCRAVDAALQKLGIDPHDRRQVLIRQSPSGGRHYFVFFDQPYHLYQYQDLLKAAGLRFAKGQIEFFPSTTHGLRLPFGHLPGKPRDPQSWIRFIDDYTAGRIKRHSLEKLYESLNSSRRHRLVKQPTTPSPGSRSGADTHNDFESTTRGSLSRCPTEQPIDSAKDIEVSSGQVRPTCNDIQQLLIEGIRHPGTRTAVLKDLAIHYIFIRGMSAEAAAERLLEWAMDPRHNSVDIQQDLVRRSDVVHRHIKRLCQWCEEHRDPKRAAKNQIGSVGFAVAELDALNQHLQMLPPAERQDMAKFYLSFLNFAHCHGKPHAGEQGWEAAPAVNAVIRKWPGCHHLNYKQRIDTAIGAGLLHLVKDKWQNPNGKGRARTYRLAVPVTTAQEWVEDYDTALARLTSESFGASGEQTSTNSHADIRSQSEPTEPNHASHPNSDHDISSVVGRQASSG